MNSAGYVDSNLVKNSALACFLLTTFVHRHEELTARSSSPDLMKILVVLPMIWHKESCNIIRKKNTNTNLRAVVLENPILRASIQERIESLTPISYQGLNLAIASGLIKRHMANDIPYVSTCFSRWPRGSKPIEAPSEMIQGIERLAFWLKDISAAETFSFLLRD